MLFRSKRSEEKISYKTLNCHKKRPRKKMPCVLRNLGPYRYPAPPHIQKRYPPFLGVFPPPTVGELCHLFLYLPCGYGTGHLFHNTHPLRGRLISYQSPRTISNLYLFVLPTYITYACYLYNKGYRPSYWVRVI